MSDLDGTLYNGAFFVEPENGEILYSSSFSSEQIHCVSDIFTKYHVNPLVYSLIDKKERVSWIKGKENEGMLYYLDSRKGDKRLRSSGQDELYEGSVFILIFPCLKKQMKHMPLQMQIQS